MNGTEVEFNVVEDEDKGKSCAHNVTLVGGEKINIHHDDREINEEMLYTGTVKFFDGWKGFGYIVPEEDIEWKGETASSENTEKGGLYVTREDIITAEDSPPKLNYDTKVQFQVYKDKNGLGACKVHNADGTPYEFKRSKRKWNNDSWSKKKSKSS